MVDRAAQRAAAVPRRIARLVLHGHVALAGRCRCIIVFINGNTQKSRKCTWRSSRGWPICHADADGDLVATNLPQAAAVARATNSGI